MGLNREITRYSPVQVGRLIRHMRTVACLSQTDLGRQLDFDRSSIANMERGTHTVSLADLMRAADLCGFDLRLCATRRGFTMQIEIPGTGVRCGTYDYRMIRRQDGEGSMLMIHEVYYDASGTCMGWNQQGVTIAADTVEELKEVLLRMARALVLPILIEHHTRVPVEEITGLPVRGTAVADLPTQKQTELQSLAEMVEEAASDSDPQIRN